jgi:hypothetical protein
MKTNSESLIIGKKLQLLEWGRNLKIEEIGVIKKPVINCIHALTYDILTKYWNLALLSRAEKKYPELSLKAKKIIFKSRVIIERSIEKSLESALKHGDIVYNDLFDSNIFSSSIKQGLSLRLPLSSCFPTKNCSWSCYAHDGMDAGRYPVIKGAINGFIAKEYEFGSIETRTTIEKLLIIQVDKAVRQAIRDKNKSDFPRDARIRFSHVGEIANFPEFANTFARQVKEISDNNVSCVVYTRHPKVKYLDHSLYVVNFTLDRDSEDRRAWIPNTARIVFSAWDGVSNPDVDVNFLEHHRFSSHASTGDGKICPVTIPVNLVNTCDEAKCDLCFTSKR